MRNSSKRATPETPTPLTPLLDDHALALFTGIAAATYRKSRSTGTLLGRPTIPFLKMGRSIRYRKEDVLEWLSQFDTYANTAEAKQAANNAQVV